RLVLTIPRRRATLGRYSDTVDGLIGPVTRGAIRAFQAAAGLKIDERASQTLLGALDAAVVAKKQRP
ncbi:MAG: peptidoglycan-binding protein, partial [Proteobacteria bacterium]|nr:peptidoglycan-binding protein [Pseudomonadota bacterium]